MWHLDVATGRYWTGANSDNDGSEAEVEDEVSGGIGTPEIVGTTVALETEAAVLASAEALIIERVRCPCILPNAVDCCF